MKREIDAFGKTISLKKIPINYIENLGKKINDPPNIQQVEKFWYTMWENWKMHNEKTITYIEHIHKQSDRMGGYQYNWNNRFHLKKKKIWKTTDLNLDINITIKELDQDI